MRRVWIVIVLIVILAIARGAGARDVIQGDDCVIQANQTYESNLIAMCRNFVLNGSVDGDLFLVAFTAEINGEVEGNIYVLGGQLDLRDRVGRDVIFAGPVLRVHPTTVFEDTRSSVISASLSTEIADNVEIPGSILSASYQLIMAGDVGREISFLGSALTIDGTVAGDIDATVGDPNSSDPSQLQTLLVPFRFESELIPPGLIVTTNGSVGGLLTYTSATEGNIEGSLEQPAVFNEIITAPNFTQINVDEESNAAWVTTYLTRVLREFISLAIIGVIGVFLIPRPLQLPLHQLRHRPVSSLGIGLLTFILSFAVWLVVLLLILLAVFLFLALRLGDLAIISLMTLGLLNVGGAGAFYFVAIYVSRIIVCLYIGRFLVRVALGDDGTTRMLYFNLLAGVAVFAALAYLPFIGGPLNALALALGLGAIFQAIMNLRATPRRQPVPATLPVDQSHQILPPPMVDEQPPSPGMNNLPEGFEWWKDD